MKKRLKVRDLLFDLDGTLIDSLGDLAATINLMLRDLGRPPVSREQVGAFIGHGIPTTVHRALVATHPNHEPPDPELHQRAIATVHAHYADEMLKTTQLFPHVVETLDHFRDKRLAVVTSKEVHFTHVMLDHFGIAKYFDAIVGGDTTPARKPDPRPVLEALRLLEGRADEAVMIGDSESDVLAGRNAGTWTIAVTFGYRTAEQLRLTEPDVIIDRFEQLQEVIE
ncbi:MAG TPA: HAD family hydrolase [Blastocatellia bacterium]|nr:HAD family hydrolase [Blastocatellia bacterium]